MPTDPRKNRLSHTAPPGRLTSVWQTVGHRIPEPWRNSLRRNGQYVYARHLDAADALLLTYPKSGSSWLRNMLAAVRAGEPIDPSELAEWIPPLHYLQRATQATSAPYEGRVVRSHDHIDTPGFRAAGRAVVLVRDPRAVAVSLYFHQVRRGATTTSIESTAELIVSQAGPSNLGSWQSHINRALCAPRKSTLIARYEDLLASPVETLGEICKFLRWNPRRDTLEMAVEHTRPDVLRKKRIESGMDDDDDPIGGIRRAEADSWREECPRMAQQTIWLAASEQMRALKYTRT